MTEVEIDRLVEVFYGRVRADAVLGPIFNVAIEHWPEHLVTMKAFWSSVMLTSGRYKGNPMAAHLKHRHAIDAAMFDRWLALWSECAFELLSAVDAVAIIAKAERIAESLKLALFFRIAPAPARHAA